jgi:small subunit ribosomal protein S30e
VLSNQKILCLKIYESHFYLIRIRCIEMPTHGSLSKAGKVRSQTPKIQSQEKTKLNPKARSRRNYEKRIVLQRKAGQN